MNQSASGFVQMFDGHYLVGKVGRGRSPKSRTRFAVEIDGSQYRIFSYFRIGSTGDFSIGVHKYLKTTRTFSLNIDKSPQDLNDEERIINIPEYKKAAMPFVVHKHSFHQSGSRNTQDKTRRRMPGELSPKSISFDKVDRAIRLFYLFPVPYSRYPLVTEGLQKHHNVFGLVGDVARTPSILEVYLCSKGFDLETRFKEKYSGFVAFMDPYTLAGKHFRLYTVLRQSSNSNFPDEEVFISETY